MYVPHELSQPPTSSDVVESICDAHAYLDDLLQALPKDHPLFSSLRSACKAVESVMNDAFNLDDTEST